MKSWMFIYPAFLLSTFFSSLAFSSSYSVHGLKVESIAQEKDDEEAPFDIRASNKLHKCGGKASNLFRVYSEYEAVSERRFSLAINAMRYGFSLSVSTHGCEGKALIVNKIRMER